MLAKKRIGLLFVMVALALPQGEARDKDYDARKHLVKAAKHRAKYNWEKMFKEARKSSRLMPTLAESYFYMGLYYYQKGQTPAAQVEFTRAIERSWNSAEPHIYLGNLAFDAGDLDRAIDEWNVGLKLDPDNPEGLANLAAGLYMSGEKLKARQHLKRALVGDPLI